MDAPLRLRELVAWLNTLIATLYPGCFAFVMATGIISNAMMIEGHRGWSDALFVVNLIAYPWLLLLTLVRVVRFWPNLQADLTNPRLIFSFFTLVAGTAVFGLGMHLRGDVTTAAVLWIVALILWLVLIYFSFGLLIFMKAQGVKVVHGAWLNAIVGTEFSGPAGRGRCPCIWRIEPNDLRVQPLALGHRSWALRNFHHATRLSPVLL